MRRLVQIKSVTIEKTVPSVSCLRVSMIVDEFKASRSEAGAHHLEATRGPSKPRGSSTHF